jgi:hypothetical protein
MIRAGLRLCDDSTRIAGQGAQRDGADYRCCGFGPGAAGGVGFGTFWSRPGIMLVPCPVVEGAGVVCSRRGDSTAAMSRLPELSM